MSNLFNALNIAGHALNVHQQAISIISNNIANMNTDGYSKQRANLGTMVVDTPIGESVQRQVDSSAGVEFESVTRYSNDYMNNYYRNQLGSSSYLSAKSSGCTDVANLFDEIKGQGLDTYLESFYKDLDNLNEYPTDYSARSLVISDASNLTSAMNSLSTKLTNLQNKNLGDGKTEESLENSQIYSSVSDMNNAVSKLAKINKQIAMSDTGTLQNNNLLDQRDSALNDLSKYGNFTVEIQDNGEANVSLGGTYVIKGNEVKSTFGIQTAADYDKYCTDNGITNTNKLNAVLTMKLDSGATIQNANSKFTSGSVGGLLDSGNPDSTTGFSTSSVLKKLDNLASSMATVFNNLQTRTGAYYIDNSTGELSNANLANYTIFNTSDGSTTFTASNISVNSLLTATNGAYKLAAAYSTDNPVNTKEVGNANNVIAMINTATNTTGTDFKDVDYMSFENYYKGIVSDVANGSTSVSDAASSQADLVSSIKSQIDSESKVDLNEELTDLVKYQTAFTASARVFSIANSVLDTLMTLGQ